MEPRGTHPPNCLSLASPLFRVPNSIFITLFLAVLPLLCRAFIIFLFHCVLSLLRITSIGPGINLWRYMKFKNSFSNLILQLSLQAESCYWYDMYNWTPGRSLIKN